MFVSLLMGIDIIWPDNWQKNQEIFQLLSSKTWRKKWEFFSPRRQKFFQTFFLLSITRSVSDSLMRDGAQQCSELHAVQCQKQVMMTKRGKYMKNCQNKSWEIRENCDSGSSEKIRRVGRYAYALVSIFSYFMGVWISPVHLRSCLITSQICTARNDLLTEPRRCHGGKKMDLCARFDL